MPRSLPVEMRCPGGPAAPTKGGRSHSQFILPFENVTSQPPSTEGSPGPRAQPGSGGILPSRDSAGWKFETTCGSSSRGLSPRPGGSIPPASPSSSEDASPAGPAPPRTLGLVVSTCSHLAVRPSACGLGDVVVRNTTRNSQAREKARTCPGSSREHAGLPAERPLPLAKGGPGAGQERPPHLVGSRSHFVHSRIRPFTPQPEKLLTVPGAVTHGVGTRASGPTSKPRSHPFPQNTPGPGCPLLSRTETQPLTPALHPVLSLRRRVVTPHLEGSLSTHSGKDEPRNPLFPTPAKRLPRLRH